MNIEPIESRTRPHRYAKRCGRAAIATIEPLEVRIAPATIFAVDNTNHLLRFDSATPDAITSTISIAGLVGAENVVSIDFRPATGELYALTNESRLYVLDPVSAVATRVGSDGAFALAGSFFGVDFNPAVDRLRVASDAEQNLRLDPITGALTSADAALAYDATTADGDPIDPNAGANPNVVGVAYSDNVGGTATTTLFGIDTELDILVVQSPPDAGTLNTVGSLGVDATAVLGFDIESRTGTAYAAIQLAGDIASRLYTINLATGAATSAGIIGTTNPVIFDIAVALPGATIVNATTATFTDADGDLVTVKTSKGTFSADDFRLSASGLGGQLMELRLHDDGTEFENANIKITTAKKPGGDGLTNVGFLNADVHALGTVKIAGDLGNVHADAGTAALNVRSFGRAAIQLLSPFGSIKSVVGPLGAVKVGGDFANAWLTANGIASLTIGGSLVGGKGTLSGTIDTSGAIGAVKIARDMIGAAGNNSGGIRAVASDITGTIASVTIGGSIVGLAENSGTICGLSSIGPVSVKGDVVGGAGAHAGSIEALVGSLGNVAIGGSLKGGSDMFAGQINAKVNIGTVSVKGDVIGGSAEQSGAIFADTGTLGPVTIGGSLIGGAGEHSGIVRSALDMGAVKIGRDVIGGLDDRSGAITIFGLGRIAGVSIGGSLVGGDGFNSGWIGGGGGGSTGGIGKVMIRGDMRGGSGTGSGEIFAFGTIDQISIGGSMIGGEGPISARIYVIGGDLGVIKIGRDVVGGTGAASGEINSPGDIASITIGGSLVGGAAADSGRIFASGDIGPVKIGRHVQGGTGNTSGFIRAMGAMTAGVTIGGSVLGAFGAESARISSDGELGPVKIRGSVIGGEGETSAFIGSLNSKAGAVKIGGSLKGGAGNFSGKIFASTDLGVVTVKGDVIGGSGNDSGSIQTGNGTIAGVTVGGSLIGGPANYTGAIVASSNTGSAGNLGPVKIGRDVIGGAGSASGLVACGIVSTTGGDIASVTIGGSLLGGSANGASIVGFTGTISALGDVGPVKIGKDIIGGSAADTADLNATGSVGGATIASVTVGGSMIAGSRSPSSFLGYSGSIAATASVGQVKIKGNMIGTEGVFASIEVLGTDPSNNAITGPTIASVTIGGRAERAFISAGYAFVGTARAEIGTVQVRGDWIASNIVAGIDDGADNLPATADDALGAGITFSRIASIVIKGNVIGTGAPGDHFGFVASEIAAMSVAGRKLPLTLNAIDPPIELSLPTGDVTVREV